MTKAADDIWMTNAIEGDRLILKVLDKRGFEFRILIALKQNIERLYDNLSE